MDNKSAISFKYCIVPQCTSTTFKTPDKIFITLPLAPNRRIKWLEACGRDPTDISQHSTGVYVCEDHFNLEEDMENYMRVKLMGGPRKIKPNVVPHIFDCQPDRKRAAPHFPRAAAVKRVKRQLVDDAVASTSKCPTDVIENLSQDPHVKAGPSNITQATDPEHFVETTLETAVLKKHVAIQAEPEHFVETTLETAVLKKNVAIQAFPKVRSKAVQCKIYSGVTVSVSPFKIPKKEVGTSPTKLFLQKTESPAKSSECESSATEHSEGHSYSEEQGTTSSGSLSCDQDLEEEKKKQFQTLSLECSIMKLRNRPRLYLGLPEYSFYTFELLGKYCNLNDTNIFLTLKKIRTGNSFASLADDFGMSESNASRIFCKSLPIISKYLRTCIIKPQINSVRENLPLAFRARYSNVFCIIDCFEIEIEKPSDAVKQSLTWSEYKKCNTLKYLISCTPDGIINFVSTGFGGRTSDAVIVEHSNFLNILPPNVAVMADRGFKHIEHLLIARGCTLIRPPSVSSNIKPSKDEVLETKRIASLRIHVERVIRRVREFTCLAPHACIDNKLIPYTDHITKIVGGLINLQSGVISGK